VNDNPILIVQKHYQSTCIILYNIAIKMTLGMSDDEFEKTINKNRLPLLSVDSFGDWDFFKKTNEIIAVVVPKNDYHEIYKIDKLSKNLLFYPIFITKTTFKRGGDIGYGKTKTRASINLEDLSVNLGKSKLYTLPFWRCKQYPNIILKNDFPIENILFSELCKNSLIEKFLKDNIDKYTNVQKKTYN